MLGMNIPRNLQILNEPRMVRVTMVLLNMWSLDTLDFLILHKSTMACG